MSIEYARFGDVMRNFGFDWEAHKVKTDDGYILTTFHVLGKTGEPWREADQGSVLVQHGSYFDAAYWAGSF